jgi:hypothetical protein
MPSHKVFAYGKREIHSSVIVFKLRIYRNALCVDAEQTFDYQSVNRLQLPTAYFAAVLPLTVREEAEFFVNVFERDRSSASGIKGQYADLVKQEGSKAEMCQVKAGGMLYYMYFTAAYGQLRIVALYVKGIQLLYHHIISSFFVFAIIIISYFFGTVNMILKITEKQSALFRQIVRFVVRYCDNE